MHSSVVWHAPGGGVGVGVRLGVGVHVGPSHVQSPVHPSWSGGMQNVWAHWQSGVGMHVEFGARVGVAVGVGVSVGVGVGGGVEIIVGVTLPPPCSPPQAAAPNTTSAISRALRIPVGSTQWPAIWLLTLMSSVADSLAETEGACFRLLRVKSSPIYSPSG